MVEINSLEVNPGKVLLNAARATGRSVDGMIDFLLHNPCDIPLDEKGVEIVRYVPPHLVGGQVGPKKSSVLVLGKMPNQEESNRKILQCGAAGDLWKSAVNKHGLDPTDWLLAHVCPFRVPDYLGGTKQLKAEFINEGLPLLAAIIKAAKPRYFLVFGADALIGINKLYFGGKLKTTFSNLRGSVLELPGGAKAVCCISPGSVIRDPAQEPEFLKDLELFIELITSGTKRVQDEIQSVTVSTFSDLRQFVDTLKAANLPEFAIDLEWGAGGNLRTLQLAWAENQGAVVHFAKAGMAPTELGTDVPKTLSMLGELLKNSKLIGHNGRGDVQVLRKLGLDLLPEFLNGFDTMLAYHLVPGNETLDKTLELVAFRILGMPRYDTKLREWCKENGLNDELMEQVAYGTVPDDILIPYGLMDVIATYRLAGAIRKQLEEWPDAANLYYNVIHPVNAPILEMEETGAFVDMERLVQLTDLVTEKLTAMLEDLQQNVNWKEYTTTTPAVVRGKNVIKTEVRDGFNPNSPQQVCEVLFGRFKVKNGQVCRSAPPEAVILNLTPVKATANDIPWDKVKAAGKEHLYSPSSDAESLGILAAEHPLAKQIQQYKFVEQLRRTFLTKYRVTDAGIQWEGGIGASVQKDGRAHTHFRMTLETGRYATSPNFQNFPKRQEKELISVFSTGGKLDPRYFPVRSVFRASPGTVLVEADWNQAELWTLGYCAKDDKFIHVLKTSDVHTTMMRRMFGPLQHDGKLISSYSVEELNKLRKKDVKLGGFRNAAKSVVFGP